MLIIVPWQQRLGGAERMLHTFLAGIDESKHEIEFVFFEDGPWPRELKAAGLTVDVVKAGRMRELHRWIAAVSRLRTILRDRQPDLILNWSGKAQLYGSPAAVLAGMSDRVVWWQHGIAKRDWLTKANWLEYGAHLLPARAIGCTSAAAAQAQARLWPRRRTFVVPAGVTARKLEHEVSERDALQLPAGVTVVGMVGRLQPWKGQDRLLRAQAILRERGHQLHLLLVGGDAYGLSTDYASSLPGLVHSLGLDDAVTLTGQVADAGPYIDRLDILVNASDPEPFGIVLLEGMARGVPVVAVDAGGPREIVQDGRTGILARSGEPKALADAIELLLRDPSLRRQMGDAGRERFAQEYTEAAVCRRFYGELERLVQGRGAGENHR